MNEQASVGLGYYLFVLRRYWVMIIAMALMCVVAVGGYLIMVPGKILASTVINVNVIVADPFNPSRPASGLLDAATEAKLASSYVVATAAAKSLNGTETAADLRDGVSVTTGLNATIVTISYVSSTADRARAGSDAIATAYIDYRQSNAEATKKKMIGNLEEQLAALTKSATGDNAAVSSRISNIEFQINQLTTIDTNGGSIITPATQNPVAVQPQPTMLLATGLLVGTFLGIIAAFILNSMARRVRDAHDVDAAGAGPVILAMDSPGGSLPPQGSDLAAYRSLRERLLAATDSNIGVLAVLDETVDWAASGVGQGLAVVLAQAGHDVDLVLVGATLAQQEKFKRVLGLTPASSGDEPKSHVLQSGLIPRLRVVFPLGSGTESDTDDHEIEVVRRRIEDRLPGVAVLLALPPNASDSSRLAVARLSQGALLVAQQRRTKIATLTERAQELADVGTACHGVVMVKVSRESGRAAHAATDFSSDLDRHPVTL